MSWFTDIFSSGVKDVIGEVGDIFDDMHTSDDEKLQAKERLAAIMNGFELKQQENANKFESEVTDRHTNDMVSDSWLSKNIRPLTLAITGGTIYLLVYLTVFGTLTELQVRVLEGWVPMLVGLFTTMVVFYFGSRGLEKVNLGKNPK